MSLVAGNLDRPRTHSTPRTSSPARSTRSDGRASRAGSTASVGQRSKSKAPTYPKKGTTLGNISLSPEEEEHFQKVLQRFDEFKLKEETRVQQLRDQLVEKQKVRIRNAEASGDGHCFNCGRLFIALLNPPTECHVCRHEFCRTCLEKMPKSKQVFCKFCHFESVHRGRLGVWFAEELRQARAAGRVRGVSGPEALRSSLLRIKRESRANSLVDHLEGKMGSLPFDTKYNETKSDYGPPSTAQWVKDTTPPSIRLPSTASMERLDSIPRRGSEASNTLQHKANSMVSLADNASQRSGQYSRVSSTRRTPVGSVTDLRESGFPGAHRPRLTSEAGSRSSLSVYSQNMPTGSMTSVYSENESSYDQGIRVSGELRLDIQYDHQSSTLRVGVKQARDLAVADKKRQTCNPYVKSYLLPDKTKASKRKTSVKKKTRNPVFEEELKYRIPYGELSERSLQVAVWHKPSVGASFFMGEVIIPFYDMQFDAGSQWYPLSEHRGATLASNTQIYRGELTVALKFVPAGTAGNQSELHVWIKSAKGLTSSSSSSSKNSSVDPYAKVYILPGKDKNTKRKTKVLKKSNNPDWNTSFVYKNIDRNELPRMGVEISVWDHDRLSSNDFLGGCRLNSGSMEHPWMDAKGTEQTVWMTMLKRPQTWFEGIIRLRPNLD